MANLGYLQLTRNCYQKCQFCSNPPTGVHLDVEQMHREIDKLVEMGYDGVILTGGEPSTSELLLPALSYARQRRLFSRMITNGQKLADKDFFRKCVDAGLTHIHVSLHSYRREVHDFITSVPRRVGHSRQVSEQRPGDGHHLRHQYGDQRLQLRSPARERAVDLRKLSVHPPLRVEQHGSRRQPRRGVPRLHPAPLRVPGIAREGDGLPARHGALFRAERVPLCYMRRYAWASTEARKTIKEEERCIRFLDFKGFVHQREFLHGKGEGCDVCRFDSICAGMYSMARTYDERELSPMFEDPYHTIVQVLGHEPSPELVARLQGRRGRRSRTEQPSVEQRQEALQRAL
jgi:hypothetical protein